MGLPQPSFDTPASDTPVDVPTEVTLPFPAKTRQFAILIDGVHADIMKVEFSDKIVVTVSQGGRLGTWITTPLAAPNPITTDPLFSTPFFTNSVFSTDDPDGLDALLPSSRFTPHTLLGAGNEQRETLARLYTSQIASLITTRNPAEGRGLLLGLGLDLGEGRRRRMAGGGRAGRDDGNGVNGVNGVNGSVRQTVDGDGDGNRDEEEVDTAAESENERERERFDKVIEAVMAVL